MATTNLLPFRPSIVKASAIPNPNSGESRRKPNSSGNWWGPLFGVSSEPDYIDDSSSSSSSAEASQSQPLPEKKSQRFAPGCFTAEKAKRLRMLTKDAAFHDVMYHSAIASRLASDFKDRSDLSD